MKKVSEILSENGYDGLAKISETLYKGEKHNAYVYSRDEYIESVKEGLLSEIPYLDNELLKKHLPKNMAMDYILDTNKELAKFDHKIISNHIIDVEKFLYEMTFAKGSFDNHCEYVHDNSKLYYMTDDDGLLVNVIVVAEL